MPEESAALARLAERLSVEAGDNIVLPVVGRMYAELENRISDLVKHNYQIYLHFVDLPIEQAVQRAIRRYGSSGRLVEPDYVASIGDAPARNIDRLIAERGDALKGWLHVSNEVPQGSAPRLVRTSDEALYRSVGDRRQGAAEVASAGGREGADVEERMAEGGVSRLTADAAGNRAISEFDDPAGPAAISQTDHLFHDLRMDADAAAARCRGIPGLFSLNPLGHPQSRTARRPESLQAECAPIQAGS